jgi:hypothetical protein
MNPSEDNAVRAETPSESGDAATGLPWLHTWKGVYLFVLGSFIIWVGLLVALTVIFS